MSTQDTHAAAQATTGDTGIIIASFCNPSTLKNLAIVNKEFKVITRDLQTKFNEWKINATNWSDGQSFVYPSIYNNELERSIVGITVCIKKDADNDTVLFCPFIDLTRASSEEQFITVTEPVPEGDDSKYELAHVHPIAFKKMLEFTSIYLKFKSTEYKDYIDIIDEALAKFPKCEGLEKSCGQMGGAKKKQYTTYNNKKYQVKIGSRGGKYIVINGQKHYIK